MTLQGTYQSVKKNARKIIAGGLIIGASALSLDSFLNTQRGTIVDPKGPVSEVFDFRNHRYSIRESEGSRMVRVGVPNLALTTYTIEDKNKDGKVDDFRLTMSGVPGASYIRLDKLDPVNSRENTQRLYDLILEDSQ